MYLKTLARIVLSAVSGNVLSPRCSRWYSHAAVARFLGLAVMRLRSKRHVVIDTQFSLFLGAVLGSVRLGRWLAGEVMRVWPPVDLTVHGPHPLLSARPSSVFDGFLVAVVVLS